MVRQKKVTNYYMKKKGFSKAEARETAKKTAHELSEAEQLYIAIYNETKPHYSEKTQRQKQLTIYQLFSIVALIFYLMWYLLTEAIMRLSVAENFILIILLANLYIISTINRRITKELHEKKALKLLKTDELIIQQLLRIEEIRRSVYAEELPRVHAVEETIEAQELLQALYMKTYSSLKNRVPVKISVFFAKLDKGIPEKIKAYFSKLMK